jgi:hypothetical protein
MDLENTEVTQDPSVVNENVLEQSPTAPAEVDNLIKTLEKEREARKKAEALAKQKSDREKQLEGELTKLKEIDPEKYWALVEEKRVREEESLLKKQQFEELKTRYQQQTQDALQREQEAQTRFTELVVDTAIKEAFFQAGGKRQSFNIDTIEGDPTPLEAVMNLIKPKITVVDGRVAVIDRTGSPELNNEGKPKSLVEKMLELRKGTLGVFFDDDNSATGTGMKNPPTTNYNGKPVTIYTKEQVRQGKANIDAIASGRAFVQ